MGVRLTVGVEETIGDLPTSPGVYLMKDAAGAVIYVGKAINLRSRVRSYFREGGDGRLQSDFLRGRVAEVEVVVTATAKEALLLENTLIKKHKPRYNVKLRDDKTYISLRIDLSGPWPRIQRIRRRPPGDKALYFGPYSSAGAVRETLRFLLTLFPLRSCPDHVLANRTRPCVLHQIGRCSAPCVGLVAPEEYRRLTDEAVLFLRGRREDVVRLLTARMMAYSEAELYEKAAVVRDRLRAVQATLEKESVHSHRVFDRDVVGLARDAGRVAVAVLCFRGGRLSDVRSFQFADHALEQPEILESFLTQYYQSGFVPVDILVPVVPANLDLLEATLSDIRNARVHLRVGERGERRRLVAMAHQNARTFLDRALAGEKSREAVLESLRGALHLDRLPRHLECFDISNFQGSFAVGSMTCFRDGEPDKSGYRRFKIRTVEGQNDFAMMKEVLGRRFGRALLEGTALPDLVIIDGGKGQLAVAIEVLRELGLIDRLPVCGLAKARLKPVGKDVEAKAWTEERIFLPGRKNPVVFRRSDPALFLLQRIRDEAHRFGIEYHRKLRGKGALRSGLEEIPGLGPVRRRALLARFGSMARLKEASIDDIAAVRGIPRELAEAVHRFLQDPGDPPPGNAGLRTRE